MNIGRVVEINQREDPKGYQREYQRIWRKNHPHYYRDKARAKARRAKRKPLKELLEKASIEHRAVLEVLKDK